MDENKVFETVEDVVTDEGIQEAAKEVVVETVIKTATKVSPWAVALLIIAGIGLIASGGWIVVGIIWLVKFLKKKFAKAAPQQDNNAEIDDKFFEEAE
jgi:hypothetical protein